MSQSLEKNEFRDANYHLSSYTINYNLFNFPKDVQAKIKLFNHLEKADYHLECFYIIKKLEDYCDYIGYKRGVSFDGKISLPPSFLEYIENSIFISEPFIKAYFLVTKMLINPTETDYFLSFKRTPRKQ